MNILDKLQLGKEYLSGPQAMTDLHAGGIFFCVPYLECVIFRENAIVEITRRVIERFRPMDGQTEIDHINNKQLIGKYSISDRNYLVCTFENLYMIGLPLIENPQMLAFNCCQKRGNNQFSMVYTLEC